MVMNIKTKDSVIFSDENTLMPQKIQFKIRVTFTLKLQAIR